MTKYKVSIRMQVRVSATSESADLSPPFCHAYPPFIPLEKNMFSASQHPRSIPTFDALFPAQ